MDEKNTRPSGVFVDLSKREFSGEQLSELELAQLREIIEVHKRARWLKQRYWYALIFAVGLPTALISLFQGITTFAKWIVRSQ